MRRAGGGAGLTAGQRQRIVSERVDFPGAPVIPGGSCEARNAGRMVIWSGSGDIKMALILALSRVAWGF